MNKAEGNLEVAIRAMLDLSSDFLITNKMVSQAVAIIERRAKRKGVGKLITFHDVSLSRVACMCLL